MSEASDASKPDPEFDASGDARRCHARRSDGQPCGRWAIRGGSVCPTHGGSIKRVKAAAVRRVERRAAEAEWQRTYGSLVGDGGDVDPSAIVLGEIRWTGAHVGWLRQRVAELPVEELMWGRTSSTVRQPAGGGSERVVEVTEKAAPNVWLTLYEAERDRLTHQCEVAARMGLEARLVATAERLGAAVAEAMRGLLDDLGLTPAQREAATTAVPARLRAVTAAFDQGA